MKRYSIVRVDGTCPIHTERLSSQEIDGMFNCSYDNCKDCRYGDTKEQLVRKVAQVIRKEDIVFYWREFREEGGAVNLATKIVEFLGVE